MDLKLNIFIAYAREDDSFRIRLEKHLSTLKRREFINTWYDGKIEPGTEWKQEIDNALDTADIILLLISADFIASDYCYEVEMKRAIERHEKNETIVIPILIHPCDWEDTPFGIIQALPQNGKPVTDQFWENSEKGLSIVAKAIKSLVENRVEVKNKELLSINSKILQAEAELIEFESKCIVIRSEKSMLETDKQNLIKEIEIIKAEMQILTGEVDFLREQNLLAEQQNLRKYKDRIKRLEKEIRGY